MACFIPEPKCVCFDSNIPPSRSKTPPFLHVTCLVDMWKTRRRYVKKTHTMMFAFRILPYPLQQFLACSFLDPTLPFFFIGNHATKTKSPRHSLSLPSPLISHFATLTLIFSPFCLYARLRQKLQQSQQEIVAPF